jgi:hypothetical protein
VIAACIDGIGLLGPGLPGWDAARGALAGRVPYVHAAMPRPVTDLLPPAERRRCGDTARLALAVGTEALSSGTVAAADVATVFTSASGNGEVVHQICESLATAARDVSPTRFHNSVHNAPAGYWSIATGARGPSTSLCAHDASFAAGMLEAAVQASREGMAVLLVAYDLPQPAPLDAVVPMTAPFGAALLVAPERSAATLAELRLDLVAPAVETRMADPALEALRAGNGAARALPLLAAVARGGAARVALAYFERSLSIEVAA